MILADETSVALTLHGLTLAGVLGILGLVLNQHSIWVRLKERMNELWYTHCTKNGKPYEPLGK